MPLINETIPAYHLCRQTLEEARYSVTGGRHYSKIINECRRFERLYKWMESLRETNHQLLGFNGAGLYSSTPIQCWDDASQVESTLAMVFASLWNERGCKEREYYGLNHDQTAMAVLVQPFFSVKLLPEQMKPDTNRLRK